MQEWMMMLMMVEMIHDDMPYILFILASRIRPSKSSLSLSLSPSTPLPLFPSLFKPSTSRVSFYFIKPLPSKALNLIDKTLS